MKDLTPASMTPASEVAGRLPNAARAETVGGGKNASVDVETWPRCSHLFCAFIYSNSVAVFQLCKYQRLNQHANKQSRHLFSERRKPKCSHRNVYFLVPLILQFHR